MLKYMHRLLCLHFKNLNCWNKKATLPATVSFHFQLRAAERVVAANNCTIIPNLNHAGRGRRTVNAILCIHVCTPQLLTNPHGLHSTALLNYTLKRRSMLVCI